MRAFPSQTSPGGEPTSDTTSWTSSNANDTLQEIQNSIVSSDQALVALIDSPNNNQLAQALARFVASGNFYADGGIADAYVLTPILSFVVPSQLQQGLRVRFFAAFSNTGVSTLNVNGLGIKSLLRKDATALSGGEIIAGEEIEATYDSSGDRFLLTSLPSTPPPALSLTGAMMYWPSLTPPAFALPRHGQTVLRASFPALFTFAQGSGIFIDDFVWTDDSDQQGKFGDGDGSTTFRIPDGRGVVDQGFDDGTRAGVGSPSYDNDEGGRVFGEFQKQATASDLTGEFGLRFNATATAGTGVFTPVSGPVFNRIELLGTTQTSRDIEFDPAGVTPVGNKARHNNNAYTPIIII